jgi:hypothetical protein
MLLARVPSSIFAPGMPVAIKLRNPDRGLSPPYSYTR